MIVTVTPNAALDLTYQVDELVPHESHRVRSVRQRAGGKGVNVASVLVRMGVPAVATGLVGGTTGDQIRADLDARGIGHRFAGCEGESRRTVNVVSEAQGDATIFNEPGPEVSEAAWHAMVEGVDSLVQDVGATVVVLSGSLPPGVPHDGYAPLVAVARERGARVIVDADGQVLRGALAAGPDLAKPNRRELAEATGIPDVASGAEALRALGARGLAVSSGADGLVLLPEDGGGWRAWLDTPLSGNPTGAGDATVAAFAAGLASGAAWPAMARQAVAWSAATVLQPVAGDVDPEDATRLAARVLIEETDR